LIKIETTLSFPHSSGILEDDESVLATRPGTPHPKVAWLIPMHPTNNPVGFAKSQLVDAEAIPLLFRFVKFFWKDDDRKSFKNAVNHDRFHFISS